MNILLKNYFRFVRRPPTKRLRSRNNFHRVRSSELSLTGAMKNADDRNFCLADYDAIGFDLDNTLAKYKLVNLMNLIYETLCELLIKRGYSKNIKDNLCTHKDFICKGLFLDTEKGNILKLSHDGKILRCSHGTRMMDKAEIISVYGPDLHWEHYEEAIECVKFHGKEYKYRLFETYFDIPAIVCCARIVDVLDEENGGQHDKYNFFMDVYNAIGDFYFPPSEGKEGLLFEGVRKEPEKYLQPCSNGVKDWLMELKGDNRVVFLMTSSKNRYAEMVVETVLGSDWKKYFDIYITYAKKTGGFFTKNEKFKEGGVTGKEVDSLEPKKTYSGGNYTDLKTFLEKQTKKSDPKVVYFGDCLCSDSFPAKVYGNWDVVLVLEEMEAEGYHPGLKDVLEPKRKVPKHEVDLYIDPEEEQYILSEGWGSFFYHEEEDPKHDKHMNTYWGRAISRYNAIAVPTVEYIAGMPINHRYKKFKESEVGNTDGFYPGKPKPLLSDI